MSTAELPHVERYHAVILEMISELMASDPPADSPEGRLLARLAAATEEFEKAHWPLEEQEPR